ncbi:MAG: 3-oxoacyl-[acyl-carrier-protein] synthase 2 [Pseudomonadota bacterium]
MSSHDLVITGLGAVTSLATGRTSTLQSLSAKPNFRQQSDYSLANFKALPLMRDKRHLKSISHADSIGMAGVSVLLDDAGLQVGAYPSDRIGVYIGSPSPCASDNDGYRDAILASSVGNGQYDLATFARLSHEARPVTLLTGLTNNVLCYTSLLLDARGPNSNYMASAVAGQMAVINAMHRIKRGKIDLAIAGGFSFATDPIYVAMLTKHGLTQKQDGDQNYETVPFGLNPAKTGMVLSDGAAFVAIEHRSRAKDRGAKPLASLLAGGIASDGLGPMRFHADGRSILRLLKKVVAEAGISPKDVGLVVSGALGVADLDQAELHALSQFFAEEQEAPALAAPAKLWGNLIEAGGLIELALVNDIYQAGALPSALSATLSDTKFGTKVDQSRPYVLVLRISAWGEYSCIVVKREEP